MEFIKRDIGDLKLLASNVQNKRGHLIDYELLSWSDIELFSRSEQVVE